MSLLAIESLGESPRVMQHRVGLTLLSMLNNASLDAKNDVINSAGRLNDVKSLQASRNALLVVIVWIFCCWNLQPISSSGE